MTRADVRDFVEKTSNHVPGVLVDAVVSELHSKLHLLGDHPKTTVLTVATMPQWIAIRIRDGLGEAEYGRILQANVG